MKFSVVSKSYPIYYSKAFTDEVERVVSKNTDIGSGQIVREVGHFISQLDCGIQDISNRTTFVSPTGVIRHMITGVGVIYFSLVEDDNGNRAIFIQDVKWTFVGYYLYPHLVEAKNKTVESMVSLMERIDQLRK